MQQLDAVFDVAAPAINLFVNPLRALFHIGDDEAGVVLRIFFRSPDDLGFDHDTAQTGPLTSRVADFSIDMFRQICSVFPLLRES